MQPRLAGFSDLYRRHSSDVYRYALALLSVRFEFDALGITWGWQGDVAPRLVMMGLGLAAWVGDFLVARRLRTTGL